VGEAVGGANHEIVEGELGVKIHGRGGFALLLEGLQFLVTEDQQFGVGIELFFQGFMDISGVTATDNVPAKIVSRVQNQVLFIELHDLGIVKSGGDDDGAKLIFDIAENLGPDIGG
jgi:hypothetical protein